MFRNRGGFTILEVMIFLAISGALLAGALVAINGQQNRTEFTQAMRDIDSKLEDSLNDVSTGNFTYNNKDCKVQVGVPTLQTVGTGDIGTRSDCVFLGEALQFSTMGTTNSVNNNTRFYTYTVLGRRQKLDALNNPIPVSSFDDSMPTAMIGGSQDLSSSYDYKQGITASKIIYNSIANGSSTPVGAYTLIGLYTSFDSSSTSSDTAQSLQTFIYNLPDSATSTYDSTGGGSAQNCINANTQAPSAGCTYEKPSKDNTWSICFLSNNDSTDTAQITLTSSATGVNTNLIFDPDPSVCPTS